MDLLRDFKVAFGVSVDELLHGTAGDVRHDADDTVATNREDGQRPAVIAAPNLEAGRLAGADQADLVEVAARLLDADDARQLRTSKRGGGGHVDRGPALDVVHDRRARWGEHT